MEQKKSGLPMNELFGNVASITCVLSGADLLDIVIEDIAALKSLSPSAEIKMISETPIDGFLIAAAKPTEIMKVPPQKDKADLSLFLQRLKKMNTDIIYCRSAESSPIILKCLENLNASLAVFFGVPPKKAVMKCKVLRIEDEASTLKNVMPFVLFANKKR